MNGHRRGRLAALALLVGCTGGPPPADGSVAPGAGPEAHADGHAHDHAAGGDHMARMGTTREALRATLGSAYDEPVSGLDDADLASGRALFEGSCVACHGASGQGDGPAAVGLQPPPADFTDAVHSRTYSDAGRVQLIRKGSPGTAMAPFEGTLSERQILDVYAYVRSLRVDSRSPAIPHDDPAGSHTHEGTP